MTLPRKVYSEERWREQDAWDQGFEAGLRRAQELAASVFTEDCCYSRLDTFDQAIDAEAAKERA